MRVRVHTSTCARTHIIQVANNCANYSEPVLLGAFVGQVCARAGARARAPLWGVPAGFVRWVWVWLQPYRGAAP